MCMNMVNLLIINPEADLCGACQRTWLAGGVVSYGAAPFSFLLANIHSGKNGIEKRTAKKQKRDFLIEPLSL